jgi:NAD(P)-dependent dehydrogenase (short-subunit alcohol dehydrogenase family)
MKFIVITKVGDVGPPQGQIESVSLRRSVELVAAFYPAISTFRWPAISVLAAGSARAAIARHLDAAGAQLVVAARVPDQATSIGHFIRADLSTPEGPAELARATMQTLGGVDILVDNVGTQTRVPDGVLAMTDTDWLQDLSGSLLSAVRLDRALLPDMIARGGGVIIHIGSNAAQLPQPGALAYASAKAALATYSKGLANQMGVHNIRVNLVSPGVIESAALGRRLQQLADENGTDIAAARQRFASTFDIPLGRIGAADDVAELVTFLASPRAKYITGTNHVIDGGLLPTVR